MVCVVFTIISTSSVQMLKDRIMVKKRLVLLTISLTAIYRLGEK